MTWVLCSERLSRAGFVHGFFMRRVCFSAAAEELGVARERLYLLKQIHGREVRIIRGSEAHHDVESVEGDIVVSAQPGVACGVRVADCAPVLVGHRTSGAVAAIHSGWRGTVLAAVEAGVRALSAIAGAEPGDGDGELLAVIGPHIEACCFEVGEEVAAQIAASSPLGDRAVYRSHPRPHVDLRAVIAAQLARAGVREIDHVRGCTVCDSERFHSYRRDGAQGGRMLAAVVARPANRPGRGVSPR